MQPSTRILIREYYYLSSRKSLGFTTINDITASKHSMYKNPNQVMDFASHLFTG